MLVEAAHPNRLPRTSWSQAHAIIRDGLATLPAPVVTLVSTLPPLMDEALFTDEHLLGYGAGTCVWDIPKQVEAPVVLAHWAPSASSQVHWSLPCYMPCSLSFHWAARSHFRPCSKFPCMWSGETAELIVWCLVLPVVMLHQAAPGAELGS